MGLDTTDSHWFYFYYEVVFSGAVASHNRNIYT